MMVDEEKSVEFKDCLLQMAPILPRLNPLDFFLWECLKLRIYRYPNQKTVEKLKKGVRRKCGKITKNVIVSTVKNFNASTQYVMSKKGAWFEQIMNSPIF